MGATTAEEDDKIQENRVRRKLERQGDRLVKCRRRDPRAIGFGLYMIVDVRDNNRIAETHDYTLNLDEAEQWADA
jgi:hypothetical protein